MTRAPVKTRGIAGIFGPFIVGSGQYRHSSGAREGRPSAILGLGAKSDGKAAVCDQAAIDAIQYGAVHTLRDPPDVKPAQDAYRQSLSLARELRMRPLEAQCHLGLGKLARQVDQSEAWRTEAGMAASMFRDMHMELWLQKA